MAFQEAPEGIVHGYEISPGVFKTGFLLLSNIYEDEDEPKSLIAFSKQEIETLDLISEGPINGLVSGTWIKSGNAGEIGYQTAQFSGYKTPESYPSLGYLKSIFWNKVPVLNDAGQFNFQNVNIAYTVGKPNGEAVQVLSPHQTTSRSIGERLFAGESNAKIYRIFNPNCKAVIVNIRIPALHVTDDENGDIGRAVLRINFFYKPMFKNKIVETYSTNFARDKAGALVPQYDLIFGKITNSPFMASSRITFLSDTFNDPNFIGWEIKIVRQTEDSTTSLTRNQTYIDSLTEIQNNIYTFPNSATVRSLFDAQYFQSIPERAFDTELLKVKIPGNYNPILKNYSTTGFATTNSGWNGEFATGKHWTDNPAWCYYDLLTNPIYGLGKYIDSSFVDKIGLYEIGKYCDTLVADGFGGLEPRFSCNLLINSREDAYKVINDMSSIFRGLTYYANNLIYTSQDREKNENEIRTIFNNSNVENGNFIYSTTSKKDRNSIAIVRYNDPLNFYQPAAEYVEDFDAIRKYGIREVEISAFGCSSRGQAIRLGRWALLSDNLEFERINFVAGMEATILRPGDVFKVFDYYRKLKLHGGRTLEAYSIQNTGSYLVLDRNIDVEPNVEYSISIAAPTYNFDSSQVTDLTSNDYQNIRKSNIQKFNFSGWQTQQSGSRTIVNLFTGIDGVNYNLGHYPVWVLELSPNYQNYTGSRYFVNQNYDYYRLINIKETEPHKYEIDGLQYNPQKFLEIESGLLFDRDILELSQIPTTPRNLNFNVFPSPPNSNIINYSFLVDDYENIGSYRVYLQTGTNFSSNNIPPVENLISTLPSNVTSDSYFTNNTGRHFFRIYSSNDIKGILSSNYLSGGLIVYGRESNQIQNTTLSSLRWVEPSDPAEPDEVVIYTGYSDNYSVTTITDTDSNPEFTWQAGLLNNSLDSTGVYYRVTVRPYSENNSRIPNPDILYQETGIADSRWQFTVDKNLSIAGGPIRDYQVIIEAHDSNGKTSAGNQIGSTSENWNLYPNGYDILSIINPRPSGIELSNNISTQESGTGPFVSVINNYISTGYIGGNGELAIQYLSGNFDSDIVGGYIYTSSGQFNKIDTLLYTGEITNRVTKNIFTFNPLNPVINSPFAAQAIGGLSSGFVSVSFFDELDNAILDRGGEIASGLYLSNNAVVSNNLAGGAILLEM